MEEAWEASVAVIMVACVESRLAVDHTVTDTEIVELGRPLDRFKSKLCTSMVVAGSVLDAKLDGDDEEREQHPILYASRHR